MRPITVPKLVKVNSLRLSTQITKDDNICFDQNRFVIKDVSSALSPVAIKLLLELMPIIVTTSTRNKTHHVVFGSRLFNIVAQILEPTAEITVHVIVEVKKKIVDRLRYLDLAVLPVLQTLSLSAAETYELINVPELLPEIWQFDSKAAFADVLGVSRSLISSKSKSKKSGENLET